MIRKIAVFVLMSAALTDMASACQRDGKDVACEEPIVIIADAQQPIGTGIVVTVLLLLGW